MTTAIGRGRVALFIPINDGTSTMLPFECGAARAAADQLAASASSAVSARRDLFREESFADDRRGTSLSLPRTVHLRGISRARDPGVEL